MDSKYSYNSKNNYKGNRFNQNSAVKFPLKRSFQAALSDVNPPAKKFAKNNHQKTANNTNRNGSGKSFTAKPSLQEFRKTLPVYKCRQTIINHINKSDTVIMMGETGSGKTTQIPQFLLKEDCAKCGIIAVTQPRRVAAITIAKRVAQEQNTTLGQLVGYTVRFDDCTSSKSKIVFLTDGCLLREALTDRMLRRYSVIMLDEAHERTVNTDVLFGIVKKAQKERRSCGMTPLKIIVTSATMDIDHFSAYFGVKGMYLEGRTHPVRVMHAKENQADYLQAIMVTIFDLHKELPTDHDMLVFLTGQEEIEAMAYQIRQIVKSNAEGMPGLRVYPLYAQLPQAKQLECFLPCNGNVRKIILATNIAETSITIPGIRCVIDCGYAKKRVYNPTSGLETLRVTRISQAQAWQRCGRAGRDAPGLCYRTYTQREFAAFESLPKPEILQSNICSINLQLLVLGIDCKTFDFLDRPSSDSIEHAISKLQSLEAVTAHSDKPVLTKLGRQMAKFPLEPHYSKMLLTASSFGCLEEMLSLIAVLSGENVFVTNTEKREQAALAHAKFKSKFGDHLTLLNVFSLFRKAERAKVWCHDNFLNFRNLSFASEVRMQLLHIAEELNLELNSCGNNYDEVRKCLLTGLFENIAKLQRDNKFYMTVTGSHRARIHPSSTFNGGYKPKFIIFSEIVLTEQNYLRNVTEIDFKWIQDILPKYSYIEAMKL